MYWLDGWAVGWGYRQDANPPLPRAGPGRLSGSACKLGPTDRTVWSHNLVGLNDTRAHAPCSMMDRARAWPVAIAVAGGDRRRRVAATRHSAEPTVQRPNLSSCPLPLHLRSSFRCPRPVRFSEARPSVPRTVELSPAFLHDTAFPAAERCSRCMLERPDVSVRLTSSTVRARAPGRMHSNRIVWPKHAAARAGPGKLMRAMKYKRSGRRDRACCGP